MTAHNHRRRVRGCHRCEISRAEEYGRLMDTPLFEAIYRELSDWPYFSRELGAPRMLDVSVRDAAIDLAGFISEHIQIAHDQGVREAQELVSDMYVSEDWVDQVSMGFAATVDQGLDELMIEETDG